MLEELCKRPFMRPLLIWIIGILMQSYCSCFNHLIWLFLPVSILLLFRVGKLRLPFVSYEARWRWGALFMIFVFSLSVCRTYSIEQTSHSSALFPQLEHLATSVQQQLLTSLDALSLEKEEKMVLETITLGNKKSMDRETRRMFSVTGVAHILSVSGFHVAVVCGFISLIFYFFPQYRWAEWLRCCLLLVLLWCFVFLTGLSASAVRAGWMLSLYSLGRLLEKRADRYNIWAASAFFMLVYHPHYLFDIGFELSYLAVFFLFWIQPDIYRWMSIRNPLVAMPWSWLSVTLAAQIGVTFLCCYYFRQFSTVFLLSAIPITGLATLLIPVGLLWMLLPTVWGEVLALNHVVEVLTKAMFSFVEQLSGFPWAAVPVEMNGLELLAAYGALFSLILALKKRRPNFLMATLIFLIFDIVF